MTSISTEENTDIVKLIYTKEDVKNVTDAIWNYACNTNKIITSTAGFADQMLSYAIKNQNNPSSLKFIKSANDLYALYKSNDILKIAQLAEKYTNTQFIK